MERRVQFELHSRMTAEEKEKMKEDIISSLPFKYRGAMRLFLACTNIDDEFGRLCALAGFDIGCEWTEEKLRADFDNRRRWIELSVGIAAAVSGIALVIFSLIG